MDRKPINKTDETSYDESNNNIKIKLATIYFFSSWFINYHYLKKIFIPLMSTEVSGALGEPSKESIHAFFILSPISLPMEIIMTVMCIILWIFENIAEFLF